MKKALLAIVLFLFSSIALVLLLVLGLNSFLSSFFGARSARDDAFSEIISPDKSSKVILKEEKHDYARKNGGYIAIFGLLQERENQGKIKGIGQCYAKKGEFILMRWIDNQHFIIKGPTGEKTYSSEDAIQICKYDEEL